MFGWDNALRFSASRMKPRRVSLFSLCSGFSILTGLIVLIASVLISKYQRIQVSVLLRTLGASRRQILIITALEYFFLGTLAAATGILLATAGGWALAHYSFETAFNPQFLPVFVVFLVGPAILG